MGFAEAVIAFIVVGLPTIAIFGICSRVYRHREKKLELEAQVAIARAADPEFARQFEDRLRVLERIVTDQGHGLAAEIEQLRVKRLSPQEGQEKQGAQPWA